MKQFRLTDLEDVIESSPYAVNEISSIQKICFAIFLASYSSVVVISDLVKHHAEDTRRINYYAVLNLLFACLFFIWGIIEINLPQSISGAYSAPLKNRCKLIC